MADIQSAVADNERGKKRKKKPQDKNIMSASAMQGGHKNVAVLVQDSVKSPKLTRTLPCHITSVEVKQ